MVLQGPKIESLFPGPKEESAKVGGRTGSLEDGFHPQPGKAAAQSHVDGTQLGVASQLEPLVCELPGLLAPALQRNVADLRPFLEEDLRGSTGEQRLVLPGATELIYEEKLRALAGHHERVG